MQGQNHCCLGWFSAPRAVCLVFDLCRSLLFVSWVAADDDLKVRLVNHARSSVSDLTRYDHVTKLQSTGFLYLISSITLLYRFALRLAVFGQCSLCVCSFDLIYSALSVDSFEITPFVEVMLQGNSEQEIQIVHFHIYSICKYLFQCLNVFWFICHKIMILHWDWCDLVALWGGVNLY